MIRLYLRREVTTCQFTPEHQKPSCLDVVVYADKALTKVKGRYHWANWKPDRRFKYINFNCFKWGIVWVPDLEVSR